MCKLNSVRCARYIFVLRMNTLHGRGGYYKWNDLSIMENSTLSLGAGESDTGDGKHNNITLPIWQFPWKKTFKNENTQAPNGKRSATMAVVIVIIFCVFLLSISLVKRLYLLSDALFCMEWFLFFCINQDMNKCPLSYTKNLYKVYFILACVVFCLICKTLILRS